MDKINQPEEQGKVSKKILNSPEYTKLIKRDWYGIDFLYLKKHKDNIFWTKFQYIDEFLEFSNRSNIDADKKHHKILPFAVDSR